MMKFSEQFKENPNEKLVHFIEKSKSLKLQNLEKAKNLFDIRAVVFFGSSGSGKTFLVDSVRELYNNLPLQIPKRLITRPQRLNDDSKENENVSKEEIDRLSPMFVTVDEDAYGSLKRALHSSDSIINWERSMEGDRKENYGFEKSIYHLNHRIKILSGNNDLARNKDAIPYEDNEVLWIGVNTPDEIREQRIKQRSPDLLKEELEYRLGDKSENILPLADIVVNNFNENEQYTKAEIQELIRKLVDIKRTTYNK